jgi:hypothetical protein
MGDQRVIPLALQVVPPPGDEDQVQGSLTHDLVGDMGTVVGLGVAGPGAGGRWSVCLMTQALTGCTKPRYQGGDHPVPSNTV